MGRVPDLDATTLAALTARVGCKSPRDANARYVCDCLAAFADGARPVLAGDVRLVGVGAKITAENAVDPVLELLTFLFHRDPDFHAEAAAVLYLASDDSRFTTAIDLVVDRGMAHV